MEKITVLYVDDNAKARRLLGSILKDYGFAVVATADASEALRHARDFSFDVVLIDHQLPDMSGAELAQELKSLCPNLPIVMISGCVALPDTELIFVNAYFGCCSALDDVLTTMWGLAHAKQSRTTNPVVAARWAHTT